MKNSLESIEKEAKFFIRDLKRVERALQSMGGVLTQPRTFERNLRFDTPDRKLSSALQVLRLRQDTRVRLTFKGPSDPNSPVSVRPEYEVEISDMDTGIHIFHALGYEIITIYEKYRTSYSLGNAEVSLDEMPFGDFLEIEGQDVAEIQRTAAHLLLDWDKRTSMSYLRIFSIVKERIGLEMRDLTFEEFSNMTIRPDNLMLDYSD